MSKLQKASEANNIYQHLLTTLKLQRLAGVGLGKLLMQLKANNLFLEAIGQGIETWNDFLKMPEIGLEVGEANRAMELYDTFCIKYQYSLEDISDAKTKSLHYLLPLAKSQSVPEERIRELVEDAKHLTQAAFKESLYDAKTGDKGERNYQFVLMRKCIETGSLQLVPGITSEQIQDVFTKGGVQLPNLQDLPEIL